MTRDSPDPDAGTAGLWGDLRDIWGMTGKVAFAITLPTLTLNGLFNELIAPFYTIWQIMALTAPLVASSTIVIMMLWRGSFADMNGLGRILTVTSAIIAPYVVAMFFGLAGPGGPRLESGAGLVVYMHPGRAIEAAMHIVLHYLSGYGIVRTASSVFCGGFLAWIYEAKLLPRAQLIRARVQGGKPDMTSDPG